MEALRGIKNLVSIEDYSLYFFGILMCFLAVIVVIALLYFIKWLRKSKLSHKRKNAWIYLNHVDFNDAKAAAYGISQHGRLLVTQENRAVFERLIQALETYKYRPEVPVFKESDKVLLTDFLGKSHV